MTADVHAAIDQLAESVVSLNSARRVAVIRDHIAEQDAEIARLNAEIQRNAEDADRYQWMSMHYRFAGKTMRDISFGADMPQPDDPEWLSGQIDAAMRANGGE